MMKLCSKCGETKPLEEFYKNASRRDGLHDECKVCSKRQNAKYYVEHKDEIKSCVASWSRNNRDKMTAYQTKYVEIHSDSVKAYRSQWKKINISRVRMTTAKRRSRIAGVTTERLPSDIWDILIDFYGARCMFPACIRTDLTLDHIIPISKGGSHSVGNFQILCGKHNSSKGNRNSIDYRPDKRLSLLVLTDLRPVV